MVLLIALLLILQVQRATKGAGPPLDQDGIASTPVTPMASNESANYFFFF
jgi:hypothetical protein